MQVILGQHYNPNNLHRIAISNLSNPERRIERWWESKYKTPIKQYEEHTYEELVIKMLEDFYENNPSEIDRFRDMVNIEDYSEEWDGRVSQEYEEQVQKGLKKFFDKNRVDLSKYQDNEAEIQDLSDEDILENLRRKFPSRGNPKKTDESEFEEDFED